MMYLSGWDWHEVWINLFFIGCGIREFVFVFTLGLVSQFCADIGLRDRELRIVRLAQIRKHWRWATAVVVMFLLSWVFLPSAKAETIIERQDEKGNVTVEVQRTAREQEMMDHAYTKPDGTLMFYLDEETGRPTTKEHFEQDFQKSVQRIIDSNNGILNEARQVRSAGGMTQDEYMEHHSRIKVMNGNLVSWVKSIHDENAPNKFQPDSQSTPQRQIRIVERKVLVSE